MIIENISKYLAFKGLSVGYCEKEIGVANGTLSKPIAKKTNIKTNTLENFLSHYPDLNHSWLITGEGDMIVKKQYSTEHNYQDVAKEGAVEYNKQKKDIPLVDAYAIGGFGGSHFTIAENDIKEHYVIPKFEQKKVDFMIEVNGSSMYPKYNSGDVVACRVIKESKVLQWNKVYVIATNENGILIKRIKKSKIKDCISLVSDNKDYDPFDLPMKEVNSLAIVVGVIRLE